MVAFILIFHTKEGGRFDLAIALGILAASGQIPIAHLHHYECVGELSLGGELRAISGVLPIAMQARNNDRKLILPRENTAEAALVKGVEILPAMHLLEVCSHLTGQHLMQFELPQEEQAAKAVDVDFADVHGQYHVKRAFEIAAAGAHNLIMLGPPGTGKSMLASRLPTILPQLTEQQAQETAAIASISDQGMDVANWLKPPYRAPHHTASAPALVGGGCHLQKLLRHFRNSCDNIAAYFARYFFDNMRNIEPPFLARYLCLYI